MGKDTNEPNTHGDFLLRCLTNPIKRKEIKMRIQTYVEAPVREKIIRLRLFNLTGSVFLAVVDENGNEVLNGRVVRITSKGKLHICYGLDPEIGLAMTKGVEGEIELD